MSERIPCITEGCKSTILKTTADRTGGYCMPCVQNIKRKEHEEFIKKNRKDIDLYEGISDPVEILKIMHSPRKYNPLENYIKYEKSIEEMYMLLSDDDMKRMKVYVASLIEDGDLERVQEILLALVCYRNANVDECLEALINEGECYPDIIFKDAPASIRDHLISQVQQASDTVNLNLIISALAWIGDTKVLELFNQWRKEPPKWKDKLYVPPEEYSFEAGWELTKEGIRKNLFNEECYAFENKEPSDNEPVRILEKNTEKCQWCGGILVNLFSIDLSNTMFEFLNLNGSRLNIATCTACNCYGPIFTDIDSKGKVLWSTLNTKPKFLSDTYEEEDIILKQPIRVSRVKRNTYHAASQFLETTFSQIGGHPTWIQDAEYPKCPKCSKHMKFIGQIDWEDIESYGEGIYYAFVCEECNIAATTYQQS